MTAVKDNPTRKPRTPSDPRNRDLRVLALTIQWHADPGRVGEIAVLEERAGVGTVPISRFAPLFTPRKDGAPRPLEHDSLHRHAPAFEVAFGPRGRIELRPGPGESIVEVEGVPLTRMMPVAPSELDRGLMIVVAGWIVLCLHRVSVTLMQERPREGLVGTSDGMAQVRADIRRVGDLNLPVLLRGETGTGKELVARALVAASRRSAKPYVRVNIGGIPAATAYAELFGYERGAFTGAVSARSGHFGAADGGTLFLDEIGATPPDVQTMLLRALDEGEVLPLGSSRARRVDVRIIAATDADLEAAVATGKFSQALYQRLSGYQIELPPLRERREDFGPLLLHFLKEVLEETGESHRLEPLVGDEDPWLSADDFARLAGGTWPGNLRALRNAARRLAVSNRGESRARIGRVEERLLEEDDRDVLRSGSDRPASPATPEPRVAPPHSARGVSNQELKRIYLENDRSVTATAEALGLPRATVGDMIDRNPLIPKASEKSDDELLGLLEEHGDDLERVAEAAGVSLHALRLRLARLRRNRSRPSSGAGGY